MAVSYPSSLMSRRRINSDDLSIDSVSTAESETQLLEELSPLAGGVGRALRKKNRNAQNCDADGHSKDLGAEIPEILLTAACESTHETDTQLLNAVSPPVEGFRKGFRRKYTIPEKHQKWNLDGHERKLPTILVNGLPVASESIAETEAFRVSTPLAGNFGRDFLKKRRSRKCSSPDGHTRTQRLSAPAGGKRRRASCPAAARCGFHRLVYQKARCLREEHGNNYAGFEQVARDLVRSVKVCMQTTDIGRNLNKTMPEDVCECDVVERLYQKKWGRGWKAAQTW